MGSAGNSNWELGIGCRRRSKGRRPGRESTALIQEGEGGGLAKVGHRGLPSGQTVHMCGRAGNMFRWTEWEVGEEERREGCRPGFGLSSW